MFILQEFNKNHTMFNNAVNIFRFFKNENDFFFKF